MRKRSGAALSLFRPCEEIEDQECERAQNGSGKQGGDTRAERVGQSVIEKKTAGHQGQESHGESHLPERLQSPTGHGLVSAVTPERPFPATKRGLGEGLPRERPARLWSGWAWNRVFSWRCHRNNGDYPPTAWSQGRGRGYRLRNLDWNSASAHLCAWSRAPDRMPRNSWNCAQNGPSG